VIAVTMGDGAGIGPEVIVAALHETDVETVVIGDAKRLCQAAEILGLDPPENVLDLDLLPPDLPWGELSPVAGEAAYRYVEKAAQLAVDKQVDAICTAPLNKAALRAAGHEFPGHTELLAHLTGTEEVSMMLSTGKLNVIHVTTHLGLIDAIERIEPGLVERTIRRGHAALGNPRIGVCAINPHAGEGGLFGDEETRVLSPAAEALGAIGPLPADTVFVRAMRGEFDVVLAPYHDVGMTAIKVAAFGRAVNITLGLPFPRTSPDHGTAFDIAGTGKADPSSMRVALEMAQRLARRKEEAGSSLRSG
jgi:4-hydroxythreonine-4-phosphate dehydrogenase